MMYKIPQHPVKYLVRIWPDGSYIQQDDWNEELFRYKGDDYLQVYLPESFTEDDIEIFIATYMKDLYK